MKSALNKADHGASASSASVMVYLSVAQRNHVRGVGGSNVAAQAQRGDYFLLRVRRPWSHQLVLPSPHEAVQGWNWKPCIVRRVTSIATPRRRWEKR